MGDLRQNTVVYITELSPVGESKAVKYVDEADRQFRTSLAEVVTALERSGVVVGFARLDDLEANGRIKKLFRLSASNDMLEFDVFLHDIIPKVVINRLKDALYAHPGYASLLREGAVTINDAATASLGDKAVSHEAVGAFMPASHIITASDPRERKTQLIEFIRKNGMAVAKPQRFSGAKGIAFIADEKDEQVNQVATSDQVYILQQFVETSAGVPGLINGRHDLRVFVSRGKMIAGALRQPKAGSFMSNTAQGGSIRFLELGQLPKSLLAYCQQIIDVLKLPVYSFVSFDFFFNGSQWYLIEINDQPGIPAGYQNKSVATAVRKELVEMYKDATK
jgi:glutathione synthase/RimK-type ligase-like ATP-grasp enzyme